MGIIQLLKLRSAWGGLEGLSREQTSLELKASDNMRDSYFLVENGVMIIQSMLDNGDFTCNFYHKIILEDFFDAFIPSKEFDIFSDRGNIQPQHIIKRQADFIKKSVYLHHKNGHMVLPMLNNIN